MGPKRLHVGAASINSLPMAFKENANKIIRAIQAARKQGLSILVCPELAISGYGCEDRFFSEGVSERSARELKRIAAVSDGMTVFVGLPCKIDGVTYNAVAAIVNGAVVGYFAKKQLAGDGVHYEPRWFKAWPSERVIMVPAFGSEGGEMVPFGDIVLDIGGVRIGAEICEEAFTYDRSGGNVAGFGVDIIVNPSASHFAFYKAQTRRRFVLDGSMRFFGAYIYANLLGNEAGKIVFDGHMMIASLGTMLSESSRFSFKDFQVIASTVDLQEIRIERSRSASFKPNHEIGDRLVRVNYPFPEDVDRALAGSSPDPWEHETSGELLKLNEYSRAIGLASWDYLLKSWSHGFSLSKSGGADSSLTAVNIAEMVRLVVAELGFEETLRKVSHIPRTGSCKTEKELVNALLILVSQPMEGATTGDTKTSARDIATEIGAEFHEIPILSIFDAVLMALVSVFGRLLSWDNEEDDLTIQNLQARIRGLVVWTISNKLNRILLTTGNRSEASVGYFTLHGDSCGTLNLVGGISKELILCFLKLHENVGVWGGRKYVSLQKVNTLPPSAGLRKISSNQTDEKDLMPYPVLQFIDGLATSKFKEPVDVLTRLLEQQEWVDRYGAEQLKTWVRRFYQLWARNQFKREQLAPTIHVDDYNVDPRTWCRFPILNSGFAEQLKELEQFELPKAA